jgi:hypothetical protein
MMRRISMAARDEVVAAVADRGKRGRILDEFAAVTGYHRKHAMRLLRAGQVNRRWGPRPGRRIYDDAVREALILVWEASDQICGKRLRPLLPILVEAIERHGHVQPAPEVRARLLAMSAATLDVWGTFSGEAIRLLIQISALQRGSYGTIRNFARRLGMIGGKEPNDAATQRPSHT